MKLFVGLGNPGVKYQNTRHNVGFAVVEEMARELTVNLNYEKKFSGFIGRASFPGVESSWLLKPDTFMNNSGRAVSAVVNFFNLEVKDILVIHDELDLRPGKIKVKKGGGSAGHNGVKDIINFCGTPEFWRIRLGIGRPEMGRNVSDYVLMPPEAEEKNQIEQAIVKTVNAIPTILSKGIEEAQMELNKF